jgi:hypothetical protein
VFCFKYLRVVAADTTVRLGAHRLQLLSSPQRASYTRAKVVVHERLDGSLAVYHQSRCLASQPAPAEAPLLRARMLPRPPLLAPVPDAARTRRPTAEHPWRRRFTTDDSSVPSEAPPQGPSGTRTNSLDSNRRLGGVR